MIVEIIKLSFTSRFATSPTITEHAVLIHEYYSKREAVPVYVTVDTKMKHGRMEIKAFIR